jgi:hypothetical protein
MAIAYFSMQDIQSVWESGGGREAYFARSTNKVSTQVIVKGKKGNFLRSQMTNAADLAEKGAYKGRGILIGTADMTGKGIKRGGDYAANVGGYVRDRAKELGGVIRKNPRAAGAIILGGTALGVAGGAYAYNNRNN